MIGIPKTQRGDLDRDKEGGGIAWVSNGGGGGRKGW